MAGTGRDQYSSPVRSIVGDSASPGFSWGKSGNVSANTWLLNETVASNKTGRNFFLYNGQMTEVSVSNENSNTFDVEIYEHDGTTFTLLHTTSVVAARSVVETVIGVTLTRGKELAIKLVNGSAKNPVVIVQVKGSSSP